MALNLSGERIPRHSLVLLAAAILLALVGVAGFILHSFAYPLALLLAALFGIVGAASLFASSSRRRGLLFGLVIAFALVTTYVFVVSGGGGPPAPAPTR